MITISDIGNLCSILGFAFAIYVYVKTRDKKK